MSMQDDGRIPEDEWKIIVQKMPIVSVDLIVMHNGGVLLGKRCNEPAKGEWCGYKEGREIRRCCASHSKARAWDRSCN